MSKRGKAASKRARKLHREAEAAFCGREAAVIAELKRREAADGLPYETVVGNAPGVAAGHRSPAELLEAMRKLTEQIKGGAA